MRAHVGDHIVVETTILDTAPRRGTIVAVLVEEDGSEHYRVHWQDGHETVFYPGPDAHLEYIG
ncbi:MAG: DUF1918 domain-containing protein [Pseudonocardia sp.]|nr:DUF1918 domain-containing protein [Pseudonocardia sp.]